MHETELKVRFCETDALGHVNNTSFFIYLEQARVEFFEQLGTQMAVDEWPFILGHVSCDFVQQAYFNQRLKVHTWVSKIGNKSFRLAQTIVDAESKEVVAKSESVMIYFNFEQQQSEPIPADLAKMLEAHVKTEISL
ncbi:thioesterase superfamily protein [Caldalkalibacillus thermarum TA2.A1]|uniref:Acyl-CoA thioesterase n=1 Tax=Caldalkalibacillus thermarum (strain TA2.A1) TaxID=986075 RepID=F5L6I9_CALTT|nr:thioesterase family protein [Caldalkalibacillus thermarum]EGL83050.1 thioesterase superfamily protein [Caldalkalibacillus thermarum TA2.A1]QZT33557.1 acyl-CoA thioesterase [Caldalkalibacillus thermarum TA2.A1]